METEGITHKNELERAEYEFSELAKHLENRADIKDAEAIERLVQAEAERHKLLNEQYSTAVKAQKHWENSREKAVAGEREKVKAAQLVETIVIKIGEHQSALHRLHEEITLRTQEVVQARTALSSLLARYGEPAENAVESVDRPAAAGGRTYPEKRGSPRRRTEHRRADKHDFHE